MNPHNLEKNIPENISEYSRAAILIRRLENDRPEIFTKLDHAMNMEGRISLVDLAKHIETNKQESGYDDKDIEGFIFNINSLLFEKNETEIERIINNILKI